MARRWSKPLIVILASAGVIAALVWTGRWARDWLDRRGHFNVAIADIQCPVPPGLDRATFLSEVQYLSGLPDRISTVDPAVVLRLASAFAAHPWVEHFDSLALRAPDGPRAILQLRTPILAVGDRVVDRLGVLLPSGTSTHGLIAFRGTTPSPKGPAGAPWGDPLVEAAARIAALLVPFQDRLHLTDVRAAPDDLTFAGAITLHWGPAGDDEAKLQRLRERLAKPDPLPETIDLTR